jgi:AcrR family transcriptional regulator
MDNVKSTPEKGPARSAEQACRERREEILEVATVLFAEQGYDDTVTQVLADKLQVGKGTIYRHFPSKRELFLAAADRVMRRMRCEVDASTVGIDDPLDQLARAIQTFLEFFATHPQYAELLIQERALFKDRKKPTFIEHREMYAERWHALYRDLIAKGRIREMPVERITQVIGNLLYGTMFTNHFAGLRPPPETQALAIVDIVFRGILSEPERRQSGSE